MADSNFKFEIKKKIAVLSDNDGRTKEINVVSFNGSEPKLDIRNWDRNSDRMSKGIALNDDEAKKLIEALKTIENDYK